MRLMDITLTAENIKKITVEIGEHLSPAKMSHYKVDRTKYTITISITGPIYTITRWENMP